MESNLILFLQLLLAHILTDFVLQPTKWVKHKRSYKATSGYLYLHSFLAGFLTYIIIRDWSLWYIAVIIAFTHYFIDLWKLQHKKDNLRIFVLDQILHLLILGIIWLLLTNTLRTVLPTLASFFSSISVLATSIAFIVVVFPAGFLIEKATKRWQDEVESTQQKTSLEAAGRYIGIFERILVLVFILTDNFSAIGFLIAAKSILRFSDKSESGARKQTEYVLIGTLMSFAITIIVGLLVRHIAF